MGLAGGAGVRVVDQVRRVGLPLGPQCRGAGSERVPASGLEARIRAPVPGPAGERVAGAGEPVSGDGHVLAGDARGVGRRTGGPPVVPVLDVGGVGLPDRVQVVACGEHGPFGDAVAALAVVVAGAVGPGVPFDELVSVAREPVGARVEHVARPAVLGFRVAAGVAVAVVVQPLLVAAPSRVQDAGPVQSPDRVRRPCLAPAVRLRVPPGERVPVAREPVLAYVDLLVGDPVLRVGLAAGRPVAVVGEAGLAGRPLRVQGERAVRRPPGSRRVPGAAPVRAGGPAGERVPVDRPAVLADGRRVSGVAIPVGGALASRGLARGRVRIVADVGLVGRPLGDHGDDPVRLRGQVRDPLAVAVRLLVVGALPPGERVPVADEPVPAQVLADVVLERLIRGAAAGRPVAGESDGVPVADPVRVHGHVVGERRVEIVFVSAVRGRVPAVEPVAGNLARVARLPAARIRCGRVVGHDPACGRAGRIGSGGRVHVVRQGGVDGPQCVYGLRPGGHDDLRPDVRVQRVPVHGVGDGHVPVVGVRVRAPPVERAVGLADLAGIPAVGVHLRGRQCDPGAGRIVDLAAGYGARRGDGLHAHGTVGSGDRPLAGPVILSGGRVGQHPAVVRDGSGFRFGALVGRKPDRAIRPGCGGFGPARLGARGHLAGSAVRLVGEDLGAGDGHAERHAHAVRTSRRVPQIVRVGERGAGPCGGQTVSDLLCAVQVRLVARIMLDARVPVGPVGGELRVPGLVGAVEPGEQLHALESQVGLRVEAVEVVEAGDAFERGGHGRAVRVCEADGPLAADAFRRVDVPQRLADACWRLLVVVDDVDPEQAVSDDLPVRVELVQLADVAAVPLFQRDARADPVFRAVRIRPCAGVRQGDGCAESGRPVDAAAGVVPCGRPVRVEPGVGQSGSGGVEREVAVVGGHVRVLEIMGGDGRPGGGRLYPAVRGCADLAGVRLVAAVGIIGEPVGEAEAQVVDDAVIGGCRQFPVLGDAPVGDHRAGLSGWDDDRALVGFPVVGMVPRVVVAFRGVRGIGVRVGDGAHVAGLVPVLLAGLGDRGAGQFDRGEMILVGAGEQCHSARVALAAAGVADAERVGGSRRRGDGLGDRTARVHVGGRVPVLLAVQFHGLVSAEVVHVPPYERGGGQARYLGALLPVRVLVVGADHALVRVHVDPGQALPLLRDAPLRGVEPAVHGQLITRGPGGDGLRLGVRSLERGRLRGIRLRIGGHLALVVLLQIMHRQAGSGFVSRESDTARGLGLGGLYGVLLAVLIGWHAAGRVRRILVVRELVRLVEA